MLIALIFFIIGYSWYYGEQNLKNNLRLKSRRIKLNELSMRFGLTRQRQKSIYFVNNQPFDTQSLFFILFLKMKICFVL
jgi:hypothetical protein